MTRADRSAGSALSPLSNPIFRAVWVASLVSNFGGMIQSVGAAWMMTSISSSAQMVALVQASVTLPIMLLSLLTGAVADNFDRKRLMLAAQGFMLTVSLLLAACAWAGLITPWLLLGFTFLIGCGAAFNAPARQASVADMVRREELPAAVALNSMSFNIARSVGPAVGGAIVAAAGAAAAFAVNAVSYIGLIAVLARWKPVRPERKLPRESVGMAMAAGLRYAAMSPAIGTVLVRSLVFGAGASCVSALMPLVARDLIGGGPLTFGLLLGSFGAGAVGGALASSRLRSRIPTEMLVRSCCIVFAAAAATVGTSAYLPLSMAALVPAGGAWVLALSIFNVTVQLNSPRWVVGRALSLYQMSAFGGMAAGAWSWGLVAEAESIGLAMALAAAVLLACAAMGLVLPVARAGDLDLAPLRDWSPPETRLDIQPRSGPVVITVEFRIREENEREFLAVMAERRRVRRRDGARRWSLLRDVADPELWIERFHVPNWIEYIRHNNRMTQADALAADRARALHAGSEPPLVRRMIEREPEAGRWPYQRTVEELSEALTDPRRFG